MADHSKIEWTETTWNFLSGCTRISDGCTNCYIERTPPFRMAHRKFDKPDIGGKTDIIVHADRLMLPMSWRKPRRVFVNSLADVFHEDVPDEIIARAFATMALTPHHTYQLLTKRHARMRSLLNHLGFRERVMAIAGSLAETDGVWAGTDLNIWPLRNVWIGVSVESQQWANVRIPALIATPAAVRWLSCEPLLGPVNLHAQDNGLHNWLPDFGPQYDDGSGEPVCQAHGISGCRQGCAFIDWVVCGGESGPGARPMHPDWARSLRDQCADAGVAFFFKQWGEYGELPLRPADIGVTVANDGTVYQPGDLTWPDGPRVGEAIRADHSHAHLHAMYRVGKKFAGRELDDRTHDEYPLAVLVATS